MACGPEALAAGCAALLEAGRGAAGGGSAAAAAAAAPPGERPFASRSCCLAVLASAAAPPAPAAAPRSQVEGEKLGGIALGVGCCCVEAACACCGPPSCCSSPPRCPPRAAGGVGPGPAFSAGAGDAASLVASRGGRGAPAGALPKNAAMLELILAV